jgi:hypothetical protein
MGKMKTWTLALLLGVTLGGCAEIAAYERETLASKRMALDEDTGETALGLTRRSIREEGLIGVSGAGSMTGGGGCGCQ